MSVEGFLSLNPLRTEDKLVIDRREVRFADEYLN